MCTTIDCIGGIYPGVVWCGSVQARGGHSCAARLVVFVSCHRLVCTPNPSARQQVAVQQATRTPTTDRRLSAYKQITKTIDTETIEEQRSSQHALSELASPAPYNDPGETVNLIDLSLFQ